MTLEDREKIRYREFNPWKLCVLIEAKGLDDTEDIRVARGKTLDGWLIYLQHPRNPKHIRFEKWNNINYIWEL